MKKTDRQKQWAANQNKAVSMTDKFIAILERLDCYDSWESILIDRMLSKKREDAGLRNKVDFEGIISAIENNLGVRVIKINSLAEEIKLDEFINQLAENPYQLKLIA